MNVRITNVELYLDVEKKKNSFYILAKFSYFIQLFHQTLMFYCVLMYFLSHLVSMLGH